MVFSINFWLRCFAFSCLCVYIFWNVYFIFQLSFPPSMFLVLTGLPCPTTGCVRSFSFLTNGEIDQSLCSNIMTIPILCFLIISVVFLIKSSNKLLTPFFGKLWFTLLFVSWFFKLISFFNNN